MTHRVKIIIPIPMGAEGVAARASQLPSRLVLPGFEPVFVSVAKGAALGDNAYDALLMDFSVVEAGLRAQEEGYAATSRPLAILAITSTAVGYDDNIIRLLMWKWNQP